MKCMGKAVWFLVMLTALVWAGGMSEVAAVTLSPGDIIVADAAGIGDTTLPGRVIRVDPGTGVQTVISEGGFLKDPAGVVIEATGMILVADMDGFGPFGSVIRINPADGSQTVLSTGVNLVAPIGIALNAAGEIFVADASNPGPGGVIKVNPVTGAQTIISHSVNFADPAGIVAHPTTGQLYVADLSSFPSLGSYGAVIKVDPAIPMGVSGGDNQTLISSNPNPGPGIFPDPGLFWDPWGIALDALGQILIADLNTSGVLGTLVPGLGAVIKVDPVTGAQTAISLGGLFVDPTGIAVDPVTGDILVADMNAGVTGLKGAVFRVNPVTGAQTLISEGDNFVDPAALTVYTVVVPPPPSVPEPGTLLLLASGLAGLAARGWWKRRKPEERT